MDNRPLIAKTLNLKCTGVIGSLFVEILKGFKKYRLILDQVQFMKIKVETKINKRLIILDCPLISRSRKEKIRKKTHFRPRKKVKFKENKKYDLLQKKVWFRKKR